MLRRAAAILLGLCLGLLGLELALRGIGLVAKDDGRDSGGVCTLGAPRRIVCIGDSNTYGIHLSPEESYPGQLAARLAELPGYPWRVENLGLPGKNSAEVRAELAGHLDRFRPEIAIVWIGTNTTWSRAKAHLWEREDEPSDVGWRETLESMRVVRMVRIWSDRAAPTAPAGAADAADAPDAPEAATAAATTADSAATTTSNTTARADFVEPGEAEQERRRRLPKLAPDELRRRVELDISRVAAICKERGVRLLLLDYPYNLRHLDDSVNPAIRAAAERAGVPLLSLAEHFEPVYQRMAPGIFQLPDYHLRANGNAELVRVLLARLVELGWVQGFDAWSELPPLLASAQRLGVQPVEWHGNQLHVDLEGSPGDTVVVRLEPLLRVTVGDPAEPWEGYDPAALEAALGSGLELAPVTLDADGRARAALSLPQVGGGLAQRLLPLVPADRLFVGFEVVLAPRERADSVLSQSRFVVDLYGGVYSGRRTGAFPLLQRP